MNVDVYRKAREYFVFKLVYLTKKYVIPFERMSAFEVCQSDSFKSHNSALSMK